MDLICALYHLRFMALRRRHVQTVCLNPKARPRHESIDVKLYTERRKESYVDFFEVARKIRFDSLSVSFIFSKDCNIHSRLFWRAIMFLRTPLLNLPGGGVDEH